jgi:zinc transporter ZupT
LCVEHTPFGGEACMDCELAYFKSRDGLYLKLWFWIGFALPWMLLAALHEGLPSGSAHSGGGRAITTGSPLLDVSIMTMVGAILLGTAVRGLRVWLHRNAFLKPAGA